MPEIVLYVNGKEVYKRLINTNDLNSVEKPEVGQYYYYNSSNGSVLKGIFESYGDKVENYQPNSQDTNSIPTYNMVDSSSSSKGTNVRNVYTERPERYNLVLNFEGEPVYENKVSKDELVVETDPQQYGKYYSSITPDNTGPFIIGEIYNIVEEKKTVQDKPINTKHTISSWFKSKKPHVIDSNPNDAKVNQQQIKKYTMFQLYTLNTNYATELYKLKSAPTHNSGTNTVGGKKKRKTRRNRK